MPRNQFGKIITYLTTVYDQLEYQAHNDDGKPRYQKREYVRPQLEMNQAVPINDPDDDSALSQVVDNRDN